MIDAIRHLRARGHDVIVFHVLDPAELEFPFESAASFRDMESAEMIPIVPDKLVAEYRARISEHTEELARLFTGSRIDYTVVDTSKPLDYALFQYLSSREKMARMR